LLRSALAGSVTPSLHAALPALALAAALVTLVPACKSGEGQAVPTGASSPALAHTATIDTGERRITFHVELARTPTERARGLMYRTRLAPDDGMLFVFDQEENQVFWMKNTLIPLDMIFIDHDLKIVGIVANAEPQTLTARSVDRPSQYVLEIGGGLSAKNGLRAGQPVEVRGTDAAH
jgi:uncharacterized membrane protein (UPF0127 family)